MGSYSKNKGKTWEREVCKIFENFLGGKFIRSPSSGAIIGGKNSKIKQFISEGAVRTFKGDIIPPENYPKLVIEAKNYNQFQFHQLYTKNKQFEIWLDQLLETLDKDDFGLLIIKITRKGMWAAFEEKSISNYTNLNHTLYSYKNMKFVIVDLFLLLNDRLDEIKLKAS